MAKARVKKTITIRLYSDDLEKLKYFAEGKEITVSGVIRQVIRKTIAENKLGDMFR